MGTLDSVNTSQIETLHKSVKEAYQNSNKVNYAAQMCFWDDRRLAVEVWEATFQHLANDKVGNCSEKIHKQYAKPTIIHLTSFMLSGLRNQNSQRILRHVEEEMGATSLEKAIVFYIQTLRQEMSGFSTSLDNYSALVKASELLMIRQATSVSLIFP